MFQNAGEGIGTMTPQTHPAAVATNVKDRDLRQRPCCWHPRSREWGGLVHRTDKATLSSRACSRVRMPSVEMLGIDSHAVVCHTDGESRDADVDGIHPLRFYAPFERS